MLRTVHPRRVARAVARPVKRARTHTCLRTETPDPHAALRAAASRRAAATAARNQTPLPGTSPTADTVVYKQQRLYLTPLPHRHRSFRPILRPAGVDLDAAWPDEVAVAPSRLPADPASSVSAAACSAQ